MKKDHRNIKTPDGFAVVYHKDEHFRPGVGVVADRFWSDAWTKQVLNVLFGCHDGQEITAIEVTREGIKAHFNKILPANAKVRI